MTSRCNVFALLCAGLLVSLAAGKITSEAEAQRYLEEYDRIQSRISNEASHIAWAYSTNMTEFNKQNMLDNSKKYKPHYEEVANNATMFEYENFNNKILKKVFKDLANKGWAALPDDKYDRLNKLSADLESTYSEAKVCRPGSDEKYSLEPGLVEILSTSTDADDLLWVWKSWRDVSGKKMREMYLEFVELSNEAARLNGFSDTGANWRQWYESEDEYDFRADIERLYNELKPFYKELHTYVKYKLKMKYGADKFPSTGHIPAHLTGNMWAQTWTNIESLVLPYETSDPVNATPAIQNMTVLEMFKMSDEFFVSLGLEPVTPEFWSNSMIEKPNDGRDVVCHASAWDFSDGRDFRIKQCTRKTMEDFVTVHHEMGHIQYYLQYKDQLYPYRTGANPGFHEAVGDVLALSVSTPKHLEAVNLIDSYEVSSDSDINYLLTMSLDKIVFLPFGKLMDDYRWSLFAGDIDNSNLNSEWWNMRCRYQGISPPVVRSEDDFDPGAKYHIPANVPYVRYFVSFVLQFQFHEALCKEANQTGPLHKCDIYQSKVAGKKLADMLKLGASQDWKDALEAITGQRELSAQPLIKYFEPLMDWLKDYNSKLPESDRTWTDACPPADELVKLDDVKSGVCEEAGGKTDQSKNTSWNIIPSSLLIFVLSVLSLL